MEVFGFTTNELIFSILLPLILFYLILFIFLKRSNIFGNVGNIFYSLTALTISLTSILSLHYIGLTKILPYLAAIITVLSFVIVYFFGVFKHSMNIIMRDEIFRKLKEEICNLMNEYEKESDEKRKEEIRKGIKEKISQIESVAKQMGMRIDDEEWYKKAKEKAV